MSVSELILPFLSYVCSETHIFSGGGDFACIYQARGSGRIFVAFGCPEVGLDWCFWFLNWIGLLMFVEVRIVFILRCLKGSDRICYHDVSRGLDSIDILRCLELWIGFVMMRCLDLELIS